MRRPIHILARLVVPRDAPSGREELAERLEVAAAVLPVHLEGSVAKVKHLVVEVPHVLVRFQLVHQDVVHLGTQLGERELSRRRVLVIVRFQHLMAF